MRTSLLLAGSVLALLSACSSGDRGAGPRAIAAISLDAPQSSLTVGQTEHVTVALRDASGNPLTGRAVTWTSSSPSVAAVDTTGLVTANAAGRAWITAAAGGRKDSVQISVIASAPSLDCAGAGGLSINVGDVHELTGAERSMLCVSGQGGSEYTLVAINNPTDAQSPTIGLEARGASDIGVAAGPPSPTRVPRATQVMAGHADVGAAFHVQLLEQEHRLLAPAMSAARGARRDLAARGARRSRIPAGGAVGPRYAISAPTVGSVIPLKTMISGQCNQPAESIVTHRGIVRAVSQHAIIVADSANPAGTGFTDAEYQSFGTTFDTLVFPLDSANFGAPTDIDSNARQIIFFTRFVNELTKKTETYSYVGGFYNPRDLFPIAADPTQRYTGCNTSNEAEMFYMLIPDPAGVLSIPHKDSSLTVQTIGTLAHEFQHLINFGRRLYVNPATTDEVVWLNEGLSHVAEELTFYRAAGLTPGQNIDQHTFATKARAWNSFLAYGQENFGRYIAYADSTERTSPYADNDDLSTRGATWAFLRYAADMKGGDQRQTWFSLVNSTTSGMDNLRTVLGDPAPLFQRFFVTNYTDDAVATAATYQFPSWNFRSVLPLFDRSGRNPLSVASVHQVPVGGTYATFLVPGGTSYLRFAVAASAVSGVQVTSQQSPPPATMTLLLVRTR